MSLAKTMTCGSDFEKVSIFLRRLLQRFCQSEKQGAKVREEEGKERKEERERDALAGKVKLDL